MAHDATAPRRFVKIAVLTVSDTRSLDTDTSGAYLQQALEEEGHQLADRKLVIDDVYQMRAIVSAWIADPEVEVDSYHWRHRLYRPRQHAGGPVSAF